MVMQEFLIKIISAVSLGFVFFSGEVTLTNERKKNLGRIFENFIVTKEAPISYMYIFFN